MVAGVPTGPSTPGSALRHITSEVETVDAVGANRRTPQRLCSPSRVGAPLCS